MADAGMTEFQKWVLVLIAAAVILGVGAYLYQGYAERRTYERFMEICLDEAREERLLYCEVLWRHGS